MKKKLIFPLLAIIGMFWAFSFVFKSNEKPPIAMPLAEPSHVPFETYIAGAGLTEPNSENISVGADVSGTVTEVLINVGDEVKKGQVLFKIEDRAAKAKMEQSRAQIAKFQSDLKDRNDQYSLILAVKDERAVSKDERNQRKNAVNAAAASLNAARAELRAAQTDIDLRTIKAPIDGTIMTKNIRLGEFANAGVSAEPMVRIGNLNPMHIRIDIDENDAWRLNKGAPAIAFVRGNPEIKVDLSFVRVEPYVRPKRSLTGESAERVDTRVLQVIYAFDPVGKPIYPGQQMDVYISTPSENTGVKKVGQN